jgi:predicted MPP superfamily phosphohydrolase
MTRIVVTSDIHYGITQLDAVEQLIGEIATLKPDAVAVAGDIGEPFPNFTRVLDVIAQLGLPTAIVPGNHDVWNRDRTIPSRELWEKRLPEEAAKRGYTYLENEILLVDDIAIIGTIAWYDYSAADPPGAYTMEEFKQRKPEFAGDALFIDWPWDDLEFCRMIEKPFAGRLETAQRDKDVKAILVVTHSPIFEEQILRKPGNINWSFSNAYFGNLTFGKIVSRFDKVRHVVSGHTHAGMQGVVGKVDGEIRVITLDSQYSKPAYVTIEF